MLWDLTWAYINKYGYDDNKYTGVGGNKNNEIGSDGYNLVVQLCRCKKCNYS
jgi:hypothetical protein